MAASLARVWPRGVWLKPQSGTSVSPSAGTPASSTASMRSATSSAVSTYEFLTSITPARDVPAGGGDLAEDLDLGHLAVGELEHQLVDLEAEHRLEDGTVRPPRERSAEVVAEAEMRPEPGAPDHGCHRRVEQGREVGRGLRMDRGRRLVDLDEVRAGGDEAIQLRPQDRHERLRGGVPRRVDLARPVGQPAGQRVRPGEGHLQRPGRARDRVAILGDDAEAVGRGDRLEDLEAVLLVVRPGPQPSRRWQRADARHVPVELGREEAGPPHLAVADDVDAGLLLVAQGEVHRVVEHLLEVGRAELAALGSVDPGHEPRRSRVRADDAGEERLLAHRSPSANAYARAGLSTNRA